MRFSLAFAAMVVTFVLAPAVAGYAPASSQDFSITNPVEPADAGRRDLMRQLQAWWDVHSYYPRHASSADEEGSVKLHLVILPDGRIWTVDLVESSGSRSLDTAGIATFRSGFVRSFAEDAPEAAVDLSLHYLLAHRHDQPVAADYTPVRSKRPFTIANDPVKSPILETMLQRTCTGTVVKQGIRNHPIYGEHIWAQAIFFRRPDGTPWVKFYEGGYAVVAPVTEVGRMVQWSRGERLKGILRYIQYTVWSDDNNNLSGNLQTSYAGEETPLNQGGTVDFTCAPDVVPRITWNSWYVDNVQVPSSDPP